MLILFVDATRADESNLAQALARRLGVPEHEFSSGAGSGSASVRVSDSTDQPDAHMHGFVARATAWARTSGAVVAVAARQRHEAERVRSLIPGSILVELVQRHTSADVVADAHRSRDVLCVSSGATPTESVELAYRALIRAGVRPRGTVRLAYSSPNQPIGSEHTERVVSKLVDGLGPLRRVLIVPPDFTRLHSGAGEITSLLWRRLESRAEVRVLPATGTHVPMTRAELESMFPGVPASAFLVHQWRSGLVSLGEVPGSFVTELSEGKLDFAVPCAVSGRLFEGYDRILSIGQLVPHEVIGIANHNKNLFVGLGGKQTIDRTHFLGAVYGMERIMGRIASPVRDVQNYMAYNFTRELPITYLLTVRRKRGSGPVETVGLFAGDDEACFFDGATLARSVNVDRVPAPLEKVVVYLDPAEFRSTWLGNKAIYRTRMALADQAELLVLAPGVNRFGEDEELDALIRRHGYSGTDAVLERVADDPELAASLSAAAHLIHGSSEGRFRIRYAAGGLTRAELEAAGYEYEQLDRALRRYDPRRLRDGMNELPDGERVFFISNPALGLWARPEALESG